MHTLAPRSAAHHVCRRHAPSAPLEAVCVAVAVRSSSAATPKAIADLPDPPPSPALDRTGRYQLRPNHPPEGVLKAPDTPDNPRVGQRMREMGEANGIKFTGKCDRSPNTLLART